MSNSNIQFDKVGFGERLYKARKSKKLIGKQLSEIMDVAHSSVSKIEAGKQSVSIESFFILVDQLGIHSDYLLYGTGPIFRDDNEQEPIEGTKEGANTVGMIEVQSKLISSLEDNAALLKENEELKKQLANISFAPDEKSAKRA